MSAARYRTDLRLWVVLSLGLLVGLGFLPLLVPHKASTHYWAEVGHGLWGDSLEPAGDQVLRLLFLGLPIVAGAIILGWIIQALVVIFMNRNRGRPSSAANSPK